MDVDRKIKKIKRRQGLCPGFSIIEVLMAVFVLAIGLVATSNLMANSIYHSADSRNQIIAAQLAQEGVELMNNIRDNNWASGKEDDQTFSSPFPTAPAVCTVDYKYVYSTGSGINCSSTDLKLYYKNGYYIHDNSGTATRFQRKIIVADDTDPTDKRITSIVTWGGNEPNIAGCNTGAKCTYSEVVLSSDNFH